MSPQVLYWDNHVIVVEKPVGLATHEDRWNPNALSLWVRAWVRTTWGKLDAVFAHPVHRLDKATSGLVVFAKTSKALRRMGEAIRQGLFHKYYIALVESDETPLNGDLEHWLAREAYCTRVCQPRIGQRAHLTFRCLARADGLSLLAVLPTTGRYHQIRAQFSQMGWPIWGDLKYGGSFSTGEIGERGIYLHHRHCALPHPISQSPLHVDSPLPTHWPSWCRGADDANTYRFEGQ